MSQYEKKKRLLTIENLGVAFDRPILRDINLAIDDIVRPGMIQGQVVALLGRSGIGKTQLFRCIAGLQRPTTGRVVVDGFAENKQAPHIGVVQQHYPLLAHRTVLGNLVFAAKQAHRRNPQKDALSMLEDFDLKDKAAFYPSQLSGGQRQRVAIIQQVLCSSRLILMDEPFSGLDIVATHNVCEMIQKISATDESSTVIVVTHDIEAAIKIADTVWIIGHQYDESGTELPGATVLANIDLAARGLAWDPDIENHPDFYATVKEIKGHFRPNVRKVQEQEAPQAAMA